MIKVLVITGPTASGKTALSTELARLCGGEIVCGDSMQVYRGLEILSASPATAERQGIAHHLFGIIEAGRRFSVAEYCEAAHKTLAEISARGALPIIVGGTGLYIDTLINNIKLIPEATDFEYRKFLLTLGRDELMEMLCGVDPDAATELASADLRRIVRALEVNRATGLTRRQVQQKSHCGEKLYESLYFAIDIDRELLYNRINSRVDDMVKNGLFEEVARLDDMGITDSETAYWAIGCKESLQYLRGEITKEVAIEMIKQSTRRYAKRQLTWLRRNKEIHWIPYSDSLQDMISRAGTLMRLHFGTEV